jgi:hypothetical protein
LVGDIKVPFGYNVPILMDYNYAKNEHSEHFGSREMNIGTNSRFAETIADYLPFST